MRENENQKCLFSSSAPLQKKPQPGGIMQPRRTCRVKRESTYIVHTLATPETDRMLMRVCVCVCQVLCRGGIFLARTQTPDCVWIGDHHILAPVVVPDDCGGGGGVRGCPDDDGLEASRNLFCKEIRSSNRVIALECMEEGGFSSKIVHPNDASAALPLSLLFKTLVTQSCSPEKRTRG